MLVLEAKLTVLVASMRLSLGAASVQRMSTVTRAAPVSQRRGYWAAPRNVPVRTSRRAESYTIRGREGDRRAPRIAYDTHSAAPVPAAGGQRARCGGRHAHARRVYYSADRRRSVQAQWRRCRWWNQAAHLRAHRIGEAGLAWHSRGC